MQRLAVLLIGALALVLLAYTAACLAGRADWLSMPLSFGDAVIEDAGPAIQAMMTALAVGLCFFLPTNARVMALETSHRRFHIGMQDVAHAYQVAHRADREGVFRLRHEFDSIRERMVFLREHPDLSDLEPSVLEVAAQMSHLSRELAAVYSDRNVARARDFLVQRQQEVEDFNLRLDHAKAVATEMRRWLDRVEMDEAVAEAQLARLCDELTEILPELHDDADPGAIVADMPDAAAPAARAEDDGDDWIPPAAHRIDPHQDDPRIVRLLNQRAAE
ncbi:DNA repair protein [Roseivivax isoporae]|nr:DNA repair protein [Roseivivax isoporae]